MTHKPLNTAVTKSGTGSRHLDCLNCTYTVLASCFACFAERGQHPKFTRTAITKKTRPLRNGAVLRGRVFLLHFPFLSYPCRPNGTGLKTVPTPFKVWGGDCSHRLNISRFFATWKLRLSPLLNPKKKLVPTTDNRTAIQRIFKYFIIS